MFFVADLWKNVLIAPSQLGRHYKQCIEEVLRNEVEGVCNSKYGYIVCVVRTLVHERGRVQNSTGLVVVPVKYQAIVCKPFKDEVIDGIVTAVNQLGFFVQSGPIRTFVSRNAIPDYFEFKDSIYTDGETNIKSDSKVRMRLQGVKYEPNGIIAVATINEDYLGPVANTGLLE